jgi:hypothetical protein
MWSLKACDIRGAKRDGHAMESNHVCHEQAHHWLVYEFDGKRLSLPP